MGAISAAQAETTNNPIERAFYRIAGTLDQKDVDLTRINQQESAIGTLRSKAAAMRTSLQQLSSTNDFLVRKASMTKTENPYFNASASAGTSTGTYDLTVTQLATETKATGTADVGADISGSTDVSGVTLSTMPLKNALKAGFFTINGTRFELYNDGDTATQTENTISLSSSLEDLFTAINTATGITGSYSNATDKVTLDGGSTEIMLGSAGDTSNLLTSWGLFGTSGTSGSTSIESAEKLGSVRVSSAIDQANLSTTPTSGTFSVNGIEFTYDVSAQSLKSVIEEVNGSEAGVILRYDSVGDKFQMTSKEAGSLSGIALSESSGNLLTAMGLDPSSTSVDVGLDAEYTLNGASYRSASNTLTESSHGVTGLSIEVVQDPADNGGSITDKIKVSADTDAVKGKLKAFFDRFNDLQSFIKSNSKIAAKKPSSSPSGLNDDPEPNPDGLFVGMSQIRDIKTSVKSLMRTEVSGLSESMNQLYDIGVSFGDGFEASIQDTEKFEKALKQNAYDVAKLFTTEVDDGSSSEDKGMVQRFDDYFENLLDTGLDFVGTTAKGSLGIAEERLNKQRSKIEDEQDDIRNTLKELMEKQKMLEQVMQENQQRSAVLQYLPK